MHDCRLNICHRNDCDDLRLPLQWTDSTCNYALLQDDLKSKHCVSKWVFWANMVIDVDQLMMYYQLAWQSLPSAAMPITQ